MKYAGIPRLLRAAAAVMLASSAAALPGGCAAIGTVPKATDIKAMNEERVKEPYVIGAGDTIAIKFFFNDRLNESVVVRPDGKISLQLINDVIAAGFTPQQLGDYLTRRYAEALKSSAESYVLGIGDTVSVKFFYNDTLNDEVMIRPDGKISLQLVNDVTAAGLTPAGLKEALEKAYAKVLEHPDVTVAIKEFKTPVATAIVTKFATNKVYVGGEVTTPTLIPLKGQVTVLKAIIHAGGPRNTARLNNVVLIRHNVSERPSVYSLDINDIISGRTEDVILKPYDVVYVPKTTIAKVDLFVEQYVIKLIPINVLFGFQYYTNSNSVQVER